jgi:glycosyltransferase involved in cell wall biosynthesis
MQNFDSKKDLKVSIIVPNYNHASYLKSRLNSILNQSWRGFELIILDDCSLDNSREIITSYEANAEVSNVIYNDTNSGIPFKQWEKGFSKAKGDWIWIAESDDWAEPGFLKLVTKKVETTNAGVIYSNSVVTDYNGHPICTYFGSSGVHQHELFHSDFEMDGLQFIRQHMLHANVIPNASAVIFKKSLLSHVDSSYMDYRINGDWLFWVELLRKTSIAYIANPLNNFRTHQQNVRSATYQDGRFLPEIFKVQEKIARYVELNTEERRLLKYNMLNRLFSEKLVQKVTVSGQRMKECMQIINSVSRGIRIPACRTIAAIRFKQWRKKASQTRK